MRRSAACLKRPVSAGGIIRLALVAAALMLGLSMPVFAQQAESSTDSVLKALNLKTDPGPMPDFIEKSRPKEEDYIAVGAQHPTRSVKTRSPAEVKALEAELNAAQVRNEHIAGRPHAVIPDKASAKPHKPVSQTQN